VQGLPESIADEHLSLNLQPEGKAFAVEGDTAVVANFAAGHAMNAVLEREAGVWTIVDELSSPTPLAWAPNHEAPVSTALSGTTLMTTGIEMLEDGSTSATRVVHVFEKDHEGWAFDQILFPSDPSEFNEFGAQIVIDGDVAAVSALGAESPGQGMGAVYIFERDGAGTWQEVQKVNEGDQARDYSIQGRQGVIRGAFGAALVLRGNTLVVGAPGEDGGHGAVYSYARDEQGDWHREQRLARWNRDLEPPLDWPPRVFGAALALSEGRLAVGKPGEGVLSTTDGPQHDECFLEHGVGAVSIFFSRRAR